MSLGPAPRLRHQLGVRHHLGDEAQLVAFLGRDVAAGQHHAHRLLERDHARQALHAAGAGGQADLGLGQGEGRLVGGDDDVAGERDLEAAAHGDAVDRGDHRLVEVVAVGRARRSPWRGWTGRLPVLACNSAWYFRSLPAQNALSPAPVMMATQSSGLAWNSSKACDQLLVRHGMAGVVDLRPVDGDDHQTAVDLDLAVLAHGVPPLLVNEDLPQLETDTKCRSTQWAAKRPFGRAE